MLERAALQAYLADLRRHGRDEAAKGAEWRFKKYVYADPLADVELERATRDDFQEWRDRHRSGRAARTVERQFRSVRAGLNRALELGHVGSPAVWKLKALQDDVEDSGKTAVFLDRAQRKARIGAAEPAAGDFLRGMELTGARPIELSAATVADFDGETLRLAHRKGRPPKLKVRHVVLSDDGVQFFKQHCQNRAPGAYIFTEDGQVPWRRHMWARKVRAAIAAHNKQVREQEPKQQELPVEASAYSFRHARTDGAAGAPHLMVAQLQLSKPASGHPIGDPQSRAKLPAYTRLPLPFAALAESRSLSWPLVLAKLAVAR